MLFDASGRSSKRACAEDFGSALRMPFSLRTNFIDSHISLRCCFAALETLRVRKLDGDILHATQNCPKDNFPEFVHFVMEPSGKQMGWHLGFESAETSFREPPTHLCIGLRKLLRAKLLLQLPFVGMANVLPPCVVLCVPSCMPSIRC